MLEHLKRLTSKPKSIALWKKSGWLSSGDWKPRRHGTAPNVRAEIAATRMRRTTAKKTNEAILVDFGLVSKVQLNAEDHGFSATPAIAIGQGDAGLPNKSWGG